ncbi:MAG: septum formation initiator family protein [Alphaproteobacteria bacterium]
MALFRELRARARVVLPAVAGLLTLGYFAYHAVNGERGLLAYWRLQETLAESHAERALTGLERGTLEHQVSLLRARNLSLDMLEERARVLLNHMHDGEVVIFDSQVQ